MNHEKWIENFPHRVPPQHQDRQPGFEYVMEPRPIFEYPDAVGSGKLNGKVALITGGDSGIGRAVALAYAREGADVAFVYLDEHEDAAETVQLLEAKGRKCLAVSGDIGLEETCKSIVQAVLETFGRLDILVNNAGEQHVQECLEDITAAQLIRTFATNIFGMFFLTKAALPHLKRGASIINTASITAYRGNEKLLDYSSTKGAVVTFTRSLSTNLMPRGIRVNAVAPGPIWTPLIPSSYSAEDVGKFGSDVPMDRPGQPVEVAPSYVFLASEDSSYMSGQVLHPNGGYIVNG
ncbi:SDR family oxidoreductase [Tumebacillus sp. ITR2]|uniref:SDR family oxidoreductase n=1 Tax=Tumebacillus amylolyticus TaxID=2801339 RepID=A0ABS1JDG2_9BACL|nr:SDR family oxidoreductase [Tumebacillus amylolyticus]MBL0388039.1 SDR family oxidoreductase [Tumebacillus amylolyticus]